MSQNDLVTPDQSRTNYRLDVQAALQALGSLMTGALAGLTTKYANQLIADTTSGHLLKQNNDNDAIDYLFPLDQRIIASAIGTDAYAITLDPAIDAYKHGVIYKFQADVANTGAATLDINGVAAWAIKKFVNGAYVPLTNYDIIVNHVCMVMADTTASVFLLLNPAVPQIFQSFQKLRVKNNSVTPNTQIDIDADLIGLTDGSAYKTVAAVNLTIDFTTTGANALDTGSLAASTIYYLHVIAKLDGTVAGLGSLSAAAPTTNMPAGYLFSKCVGFCKTNGSTHFYTFSQKDNIFLWDDMIQVVTGTSARSWTDEILSDYISVLSTRALLKGRMISATTNAYSLNIRRNGSAAVIGQLFIQVAYGNYIEGTDTVWVDTDDSQVVEVNFTTPGANVSYFVYCVGCWLDI